jgi:hypothetical protein
LRWSERYTGFLFLFLRHEKQNEAGPAATEFLGVKKGTVLYQRESKLTASAERGNWERGWKKGRLWARWRSDAAAKPPASLQDLLHWRLRNRKKK